MRINMGYIQKQQKQQNCLKDTKKTDEKSAKKMDEK